MSLLLRGNLDGWFNVSTIIFAILFAACFVLAIRAYKRNERRKALAFAVLSVGLLLRAVSGLLPMLTMGRHLLGAIASVVMIAGWFLYLAWQRKKPGIGKDGKAFSSWLSCNWF